MHSSPGIAISSLSFKEQPDSEVRLAKIVDLILGVDEKNWLTLNITGAILDNGSENGCGYQGASEEVKTNPKATRKGAGCVLRNGE